MVRFARAVVVLAALGTVVAVPSVRAEEPAAARTPYYIALGDSFTAAPLSSRPVGEFSNDGDNPYDCGKSDTNYPHLLAEHLGAYDRLVPEALAAVEHTGGSHPQFIDISCSGAETEDMWKAQGAQFPEPFKGTNPAQLSAFDRVPDDGVVTLVSIGIGGNDLGFSDIQEHCIQPPKELGGSPCRTSFETGGTDGGDLVQERLGQLRPDLDAVIAGVRERAPLAEILVFGYPALFPEEPLVAGGEEGCYPYIPVLPEDVEYLRNAEKALNQTIIDAAEAGGAHYVDWYGPSIGHDMCRPPGVAWVNGAVLVPPSFPVHPNVLGSKGAADAGIAVLERIDFDFTTGRFAGGRPDHAGPPEGRGRPDHAGPPDR